MTLAATPIVNSYIGTGTANSYSFLFSVFTSSDLLAVVTSPTGVSTLLGLTTDYTVSGLNPSGGPASSGSIVLVNNSQAWLTAGNLKTGWTLTITRNVSLDQNTSIRNQGDFYQESIESALDRIVMMVQQLQLAISPTSYPFIGTISIVNGTVVFTAAGGGPIVTTPNGLHTYQIGIANDGSIHQIQIS